MLWKCSRLRAKTSTWLSRITCRHDFLCEAKSYICLGPGFSNLYAIKLFPLLSSHSLLLSGQASCRGVNLISAASLWSVSFPLWSLITRTSLLSAQTVNLGIPVAVTPHFMPITATLSVIFEYWVPSLQREQPFFEYQEIRQSSSTVYRSIYFIQIIKKHEKHTLPLFKASY